MIQITKVTILVSNYMLEQKTCFYCYQVWRKSIICFEGRCKMKQWVVVVQVFVVVGMGFVLVWIEKDKRCRVIVSDHSGTPIYRMPRHMAMWLHVGLVPTSMSSLDRKGSIYLIMSTPCTSVIYLFLFNNILKLW